MRETQNINAQKSYLKNSNYNCSIPDIYEWMNQPTSTVTVAVDYYIFLKYLSTQVFFYSRPKIVLIKKSIIILVIMFFSRINIWGILLLLLRGQSLPARWLWSWLFRTVYSSSTISTGIRQDVDGVPPILVMTTAPGYIVGTIYVL